MGSKQQSETLFSEQLDIESDEEWVIRQVRYAKTIERLDLFATCLKRDSKDGFDYTKDESSMNRIRGAWKSSKDRIFRTEKQARLYEARNASRTVDQDDKKEAVSRPEVERSNELELGDV